MSILDSDNIIDDNSKKSLDEQLKELAPSTPLEQDALEKIFQILEQTSYVDFTKYRQPTVLRRLNRRMNLCKKHSFEEYSDFVQENSEELELLYNDLLLYFTEFFRDEHIFEIIKNKIFTPLLKKRSPKTPIRIWVPGCSTGEEAYSIAIAIYEFLEEHKSSVPVQIFGTDLVDRHIIKARSAVYSKKIGENISKERLDRFFDKTDDGFKVSKFIREMCIFAIQNITKDPPFPNIDLVSCRNVLIYFSDSFLETTIPLFHFALKSSGFLLLGTSESMGRFPQLFKAIDQKSNIYIKRETGTRPLYNFPVSASLPHFKILYDKSHVTEGVNKSSNIGITRQVDEILIENFSPPNILVDCNMLIRQFRGHVTPYLKPAKGEASLKLSKMAEETLLPDLYVAIEEVKKTKKRVKKRHFSFKKGDYVSTIDISVIPIDEVSTEGMLYIILFEELETLNDVTNVSPVQYKHDSEEIKLIKKELRETREHLQTIIEEKDDVNQELWGANEEVQSTNEELQSVNEEMEAAKEELESGNEELISLNEELRIKNIELHNSIEYVERIVDTATVMIISLNTEGEIITFNKFAERLTGYKRDNVIGRNWFDIFIAQNDKEELQKIFADLLQQTSKISQYENSIVIKSGEAKLINWNNTVLTDNSGEITGTLNIGSDITESKIVEKALHSSEKLYRNLMKNLGAGVIAHAPDTSIILVNSAACEILGLSERQIKGLEAMDPQWKFIREDGSEMPLDEYPVNQVISTKSRIADQVVGVKRPKTNDLAWVIVNGFPAINSSGEIEQVIISFIEITKRKEMQDQVRQSDKMQAIGQLAGGIAHDFNNQLAGMLGFAELIAEEVEHDPMLTMYVNKIILSVTRAADLTNKLLAFSRKGKYLSVDVDLHLIIKEVVDILMHSIDKKIVVEQHFNADLSIVLGDPTQLQNALLNLALNARDAMGHGGKLTFSTEFVQLAKKFCKSHENHILPGKYIKLSITDTGVGMDNDVIEHAFEPFFTTKEAGKGTGMGLAAVYGTVKNHNGLILINSVVDVGTTFEIYFPIVKDSEEVVATNGKNSEIKDKKLNVLLVEDEEYIQVLSKKMLEIKGHNVTVCVNGEYAVNYYRENWKLIDLVILDMVMPVMDGKEAFAELKNINSDVKVIISSGYSIGGDAQNILDAGAQGFIQKPYRVQELYKKISEVLN